MGAGLSGDAASGTASAATAAKHLPWGRWFAATAAKHLPQGSFRPSSTKGHTAVQQVGAVSAGSAKGAFVLQTRA